MYSVSRLTENLVPRTPCSLSLLSTLRNIQELTGTQNSATGIVAKKQTILTEPFADQTKHHIHMEWIVIRRWTRRI